MKKHNILFDLDDTLMDYQYSDRHAIQHVYRRLNIALTDNEYRNYFNFAAKYWSDYEKSDQKEIPEGMNKAEYVRSMLYQQFFGKELVSLDLAYELMNLYVNNLGKDNMLFDDIKPILDYLYSHYTLYIASNGPHEAQIRKLSNTGILNYFKGIVTSEDAGYSKPKKEYFDFLFREYGISPLESVFIGDSLHSDILGANQNNIYSIWYNRRQIVNTTDIVPDAEITDIKQLKKIL